MNIFDELLALIARDAFKPAISRILDLTQGAPAELGTELKTQAVILSGKYYRLESLLIDGTQSPDEHERARAGLAKSLVIYIELLREAWGHLPKPATGPSAGGAPAGAPPPDPRERKIDGNPLRHLAWLEEGIRVSRAICKIETADWTGTGFLLSGGRVITNNHVLPTREVARDAKAIFNFQRDFFGRALPFVEMCFRPDVLFATAAAKDRDCTVVALAATAAQLERWGAATLAGAEVPGDGAVSIIQHPDGGPKQIGLSGNVVSSARGDLLFYATSTMLGSSGAPVFNDDWKVIALHQGGGEWSQEHDRYLNNRGIRISALLTDPLVGPYLC